jgi:hypothetical protein
MLASLAKPGLYAARMDTPDLFGETRVTLEDLSLWVAAVAPHIIRTRRSLVLYIAMYNVPTKVATSKQAGSFDQVSASADAGKARKALDLLLAR